MTRIEQIRQREQVTGWGTFGELHADVTALLSAWDTRDAALRRLMEQWRADVAYLRQRADARYAEQTAAGLVASDALIAAVRAVEQRADALDAILKETTL